VSEIEPGWYPDPADPSTQRYWDGEGWLGEPIPAGATPPAGPPPTPTPTPAVPARVPAPIGAATGLPGSEPPAGLPPATPPPGWPPNVPFPPPPWQPGGRGPMLVPIPMDLRPHGFALAPLGSRFLARLIDFLIVLVIAGAAEFVLVRQWYAETKPIRDAITQMSVNSDSKALDNVAFTNRASTLQLIIPLVLMAIWAAYEVPFIASGGQTPGKRLMGIRVIPLEGVHPIGGFRAFRRWTTLGLPVLLWTCCGIGFLIQLLVSLSPIWNKPLHLAMHDRAAGTVVVTVPRGTEKTDGGTP
jgi:uncharacterized RDD family membrane protein YckC